MNALLELSCAPPLPHFMIVGEDDDSLGSADAWAAPGLADFAQLCGLAAVAVSAPVPIAGVSPRRRASSDLVDSLESTQTLLGASLVDACAAASAPELPSVMRFVPVPVSPPQQPYAFQQQPHGTAAFHRQHSYPALPQPDCSLYGGYGVIAPQQPQPLPFAAIAQAMEQCGWEAHSAPAQYQPQQPAVGGWEVHGAAGGISSYDLQPGFSTQFGSHLPIPSPRDDRMRRALSEEALHIGGCSLRGSYAGGLATRAEGETSEGSDGDTLGLHHAQDAPARGLPISHSAPSASLMLLERSGSNRRPLVHGHAHGSRSGLAASPRTVCLKLKATRPRPPAAARAAACAAVAAAVGEASPRPARQAARRSVAISAAAMDDDDYSYGSDTDTEPTPSGGASEERRSGGSAAGAGAGSAAASGSKKKHNPWSLTETEALVEGVRLLGPSKWAEIKKLAVGGIADVLTNRSAVDIKDKWRNLTRVAKLPKTVLKARAHKSTSDIPLELLLTVKDLMEMGRE
ncbi:SANT Myb domain [Micractinium conductrix]|uniref:SANT Myb domain n=1 Tax=Micractinium conductrix TaxID=554055 RepID=A0A2P6VRJ4_9CHLO|nr:SANT Myb domain [Micractinium conductrix]|eukprot:PSC76718.1 SANT Myb domain [Micractinium conductrix]